MQMLVSKLIVVSGNHPITYSHRHETFKKKTRGRSLIEILGHIRKCLRNIWDAIFSRGQPFGKNFVKELHKYPS